MSKTKLSLIPIVVLFATAILFFQNFTTSQVVVPLATYAASSTKFYHAIGSSVGGGWAASVSAQPNYLTYGPYVTNFTNGAYNVKFRLSVDNNSADDQVIGRLEVYDDVTQKNLAYREFHRREFNAANTAQDFELSFSTAGSNKLEFRVFYYGFSYLVHYQTSLTQLSSYGTVTYNATDSANYHAFGNAAGTAWAVTSSKGANYLTYGPYTTQFKSGSYDAIFDLQVDNNSSDNLLVATIDVNNSTTNQQLAHIDITRRQFIEANLGQNFVLPFVIDAAGAIEFRVYVYGTSYVRHNYTKIQNALPLTYNGANSALDHQIGYANGTSWVTDVTKGSGYMTFGPYASSLPTGFSTATFRLLVDNNSADNLPIARLEINDANSNQVLAQRLIQRRDFVGAQTAQDFDLVFELPAPTRLEFRVYAFGDSYLQHQSTIIRPDRLSMGAIFNSLAHFEFHKRDYFVFNGVQDSDTTSLVALDGNWFAFNRQSVSLADGIVGLRAVVRQSTDRGMTWSNPVVVAAPSGVASDYNGSMVVDGGAFFDSENDVWHYLVQCTGEGTGWNLCHYTRAGASPMGPFTADSANPVVKGGQLWSQICSGASKRCPVTMIDEGTPQIVEKKNGLFYVTFHGANYQANNVTIGARGVAATADFRTWMVSGNDLPNNAMLSSTDAASWSLPWASTGNIGFGDARILRSNGYNYILGEAADKSLACEAKQNWVFGLLRSATYGASGTWQNYSGNPFVQNALSNQSPVGCALQYMTLLRDRGEIYLNFATFNLNYAFPNYVYQLVDGAPSSARLEVK